VLLVKIFSNVFSRDAMLYLFEMYNSCKNASDFSTGMSSIALSFLSLYDVSLTLAHVRPSPDIQMKKNKKKMEKILL
jgi:hypothetical protein